MATEWGEHRIPARRVDSLSERTCWVCLGTEDDQPGSEWTHPCRCRGTTKWVHQICLQQWIDEKQRGSSSINVKCPQCQFVYHIHYPSASPLLLVYEYGNRGITLSSPLLLAGVTATSLYWLSFTHGVFAASLALGKDQFVKVFIKQENRWMMFILPLVPWAVFGLKLIRPEVLLLHLRYKILGPLFCSLLRLFPLTRPFAKVAGHRRQYSPSHIPPLSHISRCVVGTVTLPVISSIMGTALSYFVPGSTLKKTLIGCGTYLLISLAAKTYLEYHRRVRTVLVM